MWSITKETTAVLPVSNHEEADIMLVFPAGMSNDEAVIVEKDTEVFLLLIYAFLNQLKSFFLPQYMNIDSSQLLKSK